MHAQGSPTLWLSLRGLMQLESVAGILSSRGSTTPCDQLIAAIIFPSSIFLSPLPPVIRYSGGRIVR